jgi:leucyl-tRNA synthetase
MIMSKSKEVERLWEKHNLYTTDGNVSGDKKMFILPQLHYPSGSGLHMDIRSYIQHVTYMRDLTG